MYRPPESPNQLRPCRQTLDTTHEWVVKRTGVSERRIAAPNEAASDLALPAARQAMEAWPVSAIGTWIT